jgi:hypothetical protein
MTRAPLIGDVTIALGAAPAGGHGAPPPAASGHGGLWIALFFFLLLVPPLTVVACGHYRVRRMLRRCPLCAATAVRVLERDSGDTLRAWTRVQCGQCGTWRRLQTTHARFRAYRDRLARQQDGIRASIQRMQETRERHPTRGRARLG